MFDFEIGDRFETKMGTIFEIVEILPHLQYKIKFLFVKNGWPSLRKEGEVDVVTGFNLASTVKLSSKSDRIQSILEAL